MARVEAVMGGPAALPVESPSGEGAVTSRVPLTLFLGAIAASAILSSLVTLGYWNSSFQALILPLDVLQILVDLLPVLAVILVGLGHRHRVVANIAAILFLLIAPVLDVAFLVQATGNSYYGALANAGRTAGLFIPVFTVLAWLLAARLPGRSYFSLFIVGGAGMLSSLGTYIAGGVPALVLSTAGIVITVLVAPRMGRARPTNSAQWTPVPTGNGISTGDADAAYAAIPRPTTTNGFAVSALIFGLIGGTILPIIFGHVARSQIKRTGERGWGLATAGLILGYLSTTVVVVIVIVVLVLAAQARRYY